MEQPDEVYTLRQAAEFLKISYSKASRMALVGELPSHRLGRVEAGKKPQYRFLRSELIYYVKRN
jgi:excisionase family DNA binding protein